MASARNSLFIHFTSSAAALIVGVTTVACGGETGGSGGSGGSGGGTGGSNTTSTGSTAPEGCFDYAGFDGMSPAVGFKADVLPIFRTSCGLSASCHGNPSGPGAQHFLGPSVQKPEPTDAEIKTIFDQNIDKAAVEEPGMKIVAPGDPENSFLMHKLDNVECELLACADTKSCGSLMPQGGPQMGGTPLPQDKRDTIRRWIAQGAKND